jgi:hypothetical protein
MQEPGLSASHRLMAWTTYDNIISLVRSQQIGSIYTTVGSELPTYAEGLANSWATFQQYGILLME